MKPTVTVYSSASSKGGSQHPNLVLVRVQLNLSRVTTHNAEVEAISNSDASHPFKDPTFVQKYLSPSSVKTKPRESEVVDGRSSTAGIVTEEVILEPSYPIFNNVHHRQFALNVTILRHHHAIICMNWLQLNQPTINWSAAIIQITETETVDGIRDVRGLAKNLTPRPMHTWFMFPHTLPFIPPYCPHLGVWNPPLRGGGTVMSHQPRRPSVTRA